MLIKAFVNLLHVVELFSERLIESITNYTAEESGHWLPTNFHGTYRGLNVNLSHPHPNKSLTAW